MSRGRRREQREPQVGDVVAVTWLDSGTRATVHSDDEAAHVRCHVATCYGVLAYVDDERLVVRTERYDDGSGIAEAVARACVVRVDVLHRA